MLDDLLAPDRLHLAGVRNAGHELGRDGVGERGGRAGERREDRQKQAFRAHDSSQQSRHVYGAQPPNPSPTRVPTAVFLDMEGGRGVSRLVHMRRISVLTTLVLALAAACGGQVAEAPTPPAAETGQAEPARGGTLRVGLADWAQYEHDMTSPDGRADYSELDPQAEYSGTSFELFRCCLLRTLLSYNGTPTEEGGASSGPISRPGSPTSPPTGSPGRSV